MSRFTETRSCDPMLILRFCGGDWLECPTTGQSSMQRILAENGRKRPLSGRFRMGVRRHTISELFFLQSHLGI